MSTVDRVLHEMTANESLIAAAADPRAIERAVEGQEQAEGRLTTGKVFQAYTMIGDAIQAQGKGYAGLLEGGPQNTEQFLKEIARNAQIVLSKVEKLLKSNR